MNKKKQTEDPSASALPKSAPRIPSDFSCGGRAGLELEVVGSARGRSALLRNVSKILLCTETEIHVMTQKEQVIFQGRSLFCTTYANRSLRVCGCISHIEFKKEG